MGEGGSLRSQAALARTLRPSDAAGETEQLKQAVAYFLPNGAADPSIRPVGEELWVEVSVPKTGAPRPIRLAVKKDGRLTPLELR